MKKRTLTQNLILSLKGIGMGAADVVPGVSGGTIAFISGIYQELIDSISNVNIGALKVWKQEGFRVFWNHINGTFFLFLFGGIGVSIVSLSKLVTKLLKEEPILVWSFFFGLIIASVWLIGKQIKTWNWRTIVPAVFGMAIAYYITTIQAVGAIEGKWFIFLSGAIAICAMILPGISGSFILILLGSYETIFGSLSKLTSDDLEFDHILIIVLFVSGCLVGLISFARVLKYLFKNYEGITIATLTGFMIGSLNKVWPWKEHIETRLNSHDEVVPFIDVNVLPNDAYRIINDLDKQLGVQVKDPQIMLAILCALGGLALIIILERFAPKQP